MVIEEGGKRILTDPGNFSDAQNSLTGIDAVVITHEHGDHFHADSVQAIVKNNPSARIISNAAVGKHLETLGVKHEVVDGRGTTSLGSIPLEAFDCRHEEIFEEYGQVQNTAYLIGEMLIPGDAFFDPASVGAPGKVRVLALPVAGPWCRFPDAMRYAINMKPQKALPIHDAVMRQGMGGFVYQLSQKILKSKADIDFVPMGEGAEAEF